MNVRSSHVTLVLYPVFGGRDLLSNNLILNKFRYGAFLIKDYIFDTHM